MINIFILSIFIGYFAIWHVTPTLHSPLMSLTNAISGIVILGALQILHNLPSFISPLWIYFNIFCISKYFWWILHNQTYAKYVQTEEKR